MNTDVINSLTMIINISIDTSYNSNNDNNQY